MIDLLIDIPYLWLQDGYGQTGPEVVLALAEFCDRHGLNWRVLRSHIISAAPDRTEETKLITSHFVNSREAHQCKVYFRYNYPKVFTTGERALMGKLVSYTMFETDKCPSNWREALDQSDVVLVPTPYLQSVFQCGTSSPVSTLYLPLNQEYYKLLDKSTLTDSLPERFTFSFVGTNTDEDRKGIRALVKAFCSSDIDADLKIFSRNWTPPADKRIISEGRAVKTITQMRDFYLSSHCGVYPSRGEGYGLPQIETSFMGRPVIVASNSSISWLATFMPWVDMAPCIPEPAIYARKDLGDVGNWGYVSLSYFLSSMRTTVEDWVKRPENYKKNIIMAHKKNQLRDILAGSSIQEQLDRNLLPLF